MKRRGSIAAATGIVVLALSSTTALADPNADNASCMGLGSSFYAHFAPEQRAFVSLIVNDIAKAEELPPGSVYSTFGQEKEGGSIPSPCGTRLE